MNQVEAKRCSQRHFYVAAALFWTAVIGHSSAMASCGDYLLHAGLTGSELPAEFRSIPTSLLDSVARVPVHHPICENGNCQQSPLTTTPLETPRTTVPQQPALVGVPDGDGIDHRDSRWNWPGDGFSFDLPFLEVDVPPPRCS